MSARNKSALTPFFFADVASLDIAWKHDPRLPTDHLALVHMAPKLLVDLEDKTEEMKQALA